MLKTLKDYDQKEAEGILSRMALDLMPDPGIDEKAHVVQSEMVLRKEIINEIRRRTKLPPTDNSRKARTRIISYLSDEMSRVALHGVDIESIKSSLGRRGYLHSEQYHVTFSDQFDEVTAKSGVTRKAAKNAVLNPDAVEHVNPEKSTAPDAVAISLYLKVFPAARKKDTYTLLVSTHRDGATQRIIDAWIVLHAEVDLTMTKSPVDVLKVFVNKYGASIKVGNTVGKFIFYVSIPLPESSKETEVVSVLEPAPTDAVHQFMIKINKDRKTVDVALAFAIDRTKYRADLVKHGISVSS